MANQLTAVATSSATCPACGADILLDIGCGGGETVGDSFVVDVFVIAMRGCEHADNWKPNQPLPEGLN